MSTSRSDTVCPNCGTEVAPGRKFCVQCGVSLDTATTDAALMPSHWQLTIATGPKAGQSFPLGDRVRIGRKPDNDICIEGKQVSRHHAILEHTERGYLITDLNSINGTYVNSARISRPTFVYSGDTITIHDTQLTIQETKPSPTGPGEVVVCPACGARFEHTRNFCGECGTRLG